MGLKITDAVIDLGVITVVDKDGRSASISFDDEHVIHKRRPLQGKKASVSLALLLDRALLENRDFFEHPSVE
jgi:hypothetical protein